MRSGAKGSRDVRVLYVLFDFELGGYYIKAGLGRPCVTCFGKELPAKFATELHTIVCLSMPGPVLGDFVRFIFFPGRRKSQEAVGVEGWREKMFLSSFEVDKVWRTTPRVHRKVRSD